MLEYIAQIGNLQGVEQKSWKRYLIFETEHLGSATEDKRSKEEKRIELQFVELLYEMNTDHFFVGMNFLF